MRWLTGLAAALAAIVVVVPPAFAQLPAMRDRPLSAAERGRLQGLEGEIQRISVQRNTSAAAVRAIASKLGARLTTSDPAEIIRLIDRSAESLSTARGKISQLEKELESLDSMRLARAVSPLLEAASAAIEEGDLDLAEAKLAEASDQFASARQNLEGRLADISTREADILAQRAAVRKAGFDSKGAADLYGQAAALVPDEAKALKWKYLFAQGEALTESGQDGGDRAGLEKAVAILRDQALPLVPRETAPEDWLATQGALGAALRYLGNWHNVEAASREAVEALKLVAEATPPEPRETWIIRQGAHATAVSELYSYDPGVGVLEEALRIYDAAFAAGPPEDFKTNANRAVILFRVGSWYDDIDRVQRAGADYKAAIATLDPALSPRAWIRGMMNLTAFNQAIGQLSDRTSSYEDAVATAREVLERADPLQFPALHRQAKAGLGSALATLARRPDHAQRSPAVTEAISLLEAAVAETPKEEARSWYHSMGYLAGAYRAAGELEEGTARVDQAIATYQSMLDTVSKDDNPGDWMPVRLSLADLMLMRGRRVTGEARRQSLAEAEQAYRDIQPIATAMEDTWALEDAAEGLAAVAEARSGDGAG